MEALLTRKQVEERIGFKRTWIYEMIKAGEFPAPKKIGYCTRWLDSDIEGWLENLKTA